MGDLTPLNAVDDCILGEEVVITVGEPLDENLIVVNPPNNRIENYFDWPVTPIKTGTQPTKVKKPFVITSPIWIETEKEKKLLKENQLLQKENRKTERIEKLKKKKEEIELKASTKKENKLKKTKLSKIKNQFKTNLKSRGNANKLQDSTASTSVQIISNEGVILDLAVNNNGEAHDQDSHDIDSLSEVALEPIPSHAESPGLEKEEDDNTKNRNIGQNKFAKGTMCYNCTFAFSKTQTFDNVGIRCNTCVREFHVKCIQVLKLQLLPMFVCSKCKIQSDEL